MRLAQHMAVASDQIRSDCIDASEFRELAQRYAVMAVPKVIINDRVEFEGALPEPEFLKAVLRAIDGSEAPA